MIIFCKKAIKRAREKKGKGKGRKEGCEREGKRERIERTKEGCMKGRRERNWLLRVAGASCDSVECSLIVP